MKIVSASDLHITNKRPKNRKDNYFKTVLDKLVQLLKLTQKVDSKTLLIAGDFFDFYNMPFDVVRMVLRILFQYPDVVLIIVPGQHDQRYHRTGLNNTPLGLLAECEQVHLLKNDTIYKIHNRNAENFDFITVIGAGWNEEPKVKAQVVLTHQMVVKNEKLFYDQKEYITSKALLKKYSWAKCIISGDNHLPFKIQSNGRLLINCGSMTRSSKDQINHKPKAWIIDTNKWTAIPKKLKISKPEKVFDFNKIAEEEIKEEIKQKASDEIDKFINSLPATSKNKIKPKVILKHVITKMKPKKSVKNLINLIMEEVS